MEGDLHQTVGRNLRAYREARGLSQEAFIDLVGVHCTYVGGLERGERNVTLRSVERIAVPSSQMVHRIPRARGGAYHGAFAGTRLSDAREVASAPPARAARVVARSRSQPSLEGLHVVPVAVVWPQPPRVMLLSPSAGDALTGLRPSRSNEP
jgi:hypothetical protein